MLDGNLHYPPPNHPRMKTVSSVRLSVRPSVRSFVRPFACMSIHSRYMFAESLVVVVVVFAAVGHIIIVLLSPRAKQASKRRSINGEIPLLPHSFLEAPPPISSLFRGWMVDGDNYCTLRRMDGGGRVSRVWCALLGPPCSGLGGARTHE